MRGVGVTPESGAHSVPFHESRVKQEKKEMLIAADMAKVRNVRLDWLPITVPAAARFARLSRR
jgi:hypothetical protein